METSNEMKAKMFAQYLGQKVITPTQDGEGDAFGYLTGIHGDYEAEVQHIYEHHAAEQPDYYEYDKIKLILKPLSAITDEEIIECAIIAHKLAFSGNNPKSKWKVVRSPQNFADVKTKYSEFVFQLDLDGGFPLMEIYREEDLSSSCRTEFVYQFLQSKGYDLPHYLLGGKTLYEAGLAIYEHHNKQK